MFLESAHTARRGFRTRRTDTAFLARAVAKGSGHQPPRTATPGSPCRAISTWSARHRCER